MNEKYLRQLPAVHQFQQGESYQILQQHFDERQIVNVIREVLAEARRNILQQGASALQTLADYHAIVRERLHQMHQPKIQPVFNATGIILHTNLGRAPILPAAAHAASAVATGYSNLELDLESGKRSKRQLPLRSALQHLIGCESATAVNNCAAATIIVLRAIATGKEVIVSRGQLVEIGGSFRIPEIMTVSGATLREVGTTNITRLADYEKNIHENTAALMRVHCSNYRIQGFTESVPLQALVELGKKYHLPVIDDLGSGALEDFSQYGLQADPTVQESIATGADVVLFSGDKLLGGPQAGLIVGKKQWIDRIESDPLMRALRLDKMTLAAMEVTLLHHLQGGKASEPLPTQEMYRRPLAQVESQARTLATALQSYFPPGQIQVVPTEAYLGGGTLPDSAMPSWGVRLVHSDWSSEELAKKLRTLARPPVLARIVHDAVVLDVRTIPTRQQDAFTETLKELFEQQ
ncbi:MAG: L-seryl-tRNA(Sec) selenium transferase [Zavarzinella sp.]